MTDPTPDTTTEERTEDRRVELERLRLENDRRRLELLERRIYIDQRDAAIGVILALLAPTPEKRLAVDLAIAKATSVLLDEAEKRQTPTPANRAARRRAERGRR